MLNQFYKYISSLLISYLDKTGVKAGDRYYLHLDNSSEVEHLVEAMRNLDNVVPFTYKHQYGGEYKTIAIQFGNHRLIVASTSENVKPDFLVTLRNLVGEQKGEWHNTSLISIVSEELDSIKGGSSDLQKEGMPLHANSINNSLKKEIEDSNLEKVEKIILQDNLKNIMKEQLFKQVTFFEFESIFSTLQVGSIDDSEYHKFGLFKDPDLASFQGKEQEKRINLNRELFDFVERNHDYGYEKEELEKRFSPKGANELIKGEWKDSLFPDVNKFHSEYKESKKRIKIELESLKFTNNLKVWEKPYKDSAAGKRKRHIVIFNPEQHNEIAFQAAFNLTGNIKSLSEKYFTLNNERKYKDIIQFQVKQSNIHAKIDLKQDNDAKEPLFFKFSYKHDKKSSLGAEVSVAVLPIDPVDLDRYKSKYLVNTKKNALEIEYEEEELILGNGIDQQRIELVKQNQDVIFTEDLKLTIIPEAEVFNDDDELCLTIKFKDTPVPVILRNVTPETTPITGQRIWKLIREAGKDMKWIKHNNRLELENREFYFHAEYKRFFEWESHFVEQGMKAAWYASDDLKPVSLKIGEDLRESYSRFINYFKKEETIPSLSTVTEDLKTRALDYIKEYKKEIIRFEDAAAAGKKGLDLFKLGTVQTNGELYFSPFHPLMVAYKLKYYELIGKEEIENNIVNRMSPDGLVPYIYDENENLYRPDYQHSAMEWLTFKPVNQISVSDANQYLAKVVNDKITQFKKHFSYLFITNSQASLQLNVINIVNDHEVIRGILQWMIGIIDKEGPESLMPIEVTLYKEKHIESSFDKYARTETVSQFEELFDLKLRAKEYDADDVLRMIREKLFFYKKSIDKEYRYAHISFYKMDAEEKKAIQPMKDMKSGLAIDGLLSSLPSMKDEENYKSGFGTKEYSIDGNNVLASTAYYINELAANLRNGGNDSYRVGEAIFSRTTTGDEKILEKIYRSSYWVTFVDSTIDLEFFNKYEGNLVVIHYSDQYSSSSRYDAITVTDKSDQYFAVIKEFLNKKNVKGNSVNVQNTIKSFNTFNGEWLLRIIGSKGHNDREKLSIISAIKYTVSYLDHPNILWIPISLEEVLRVAGAASLSKSEGVFTAKNLGVSGSHSDDLLLIGIEKVEDNLSLHFYPVEVKIGLNKGTVLEKAREQVRKTKALLMDTLTGKEGESFAGKFYRNFFAQLIISSAQKLEQSEFWNEKDYKLDEKVVEKLLKDQYTISNKLLKFAGEGSILSFEKNAYHRSAILDDDVLLINLTEYDGYEGLVNPVKKMRDWIQEEPNDFIKEKMLSYVYKVEDNVDTENNLNTEDDTFSNVTPEKENVSTEEFHEDVPGKSNDENYNPEKDIKQEDMNSQDENKEDKSEFVQGLDDNNLEEVEEKEKEVITKTNLEDVRILIGTAENSNREVFWEYGNKGLANRHLLISGKSGQGKTYFMQCLLLEKSKMGIPSIVIDYTEGFLPDQLEPEFVEYMGDKITQKIVYSEKFPINPFKKNIRNIGGQEIPESNTDVAERIQSVFSAVYSTLGIQQLNAIYESTISGLERYNENMNLEKLKVMLEEDGSNYAKTALSQIRPLIDRNPFSHENTIDWKDVFESKGELFIIQLTLFPRNVQLIITEFILWDLWNYSVRFGNKNNPMPVIMDEAQNLDHTEKSPSARILTEGRKFGWSGWYATQFLKSQLSSDELARLQNSSQKVYFSPPEQELSHIASGLSKDPNEKKQWEKKLSEIKKGQCVVHGPILDNFGELTNPTINVVDITPLSKRI